MCQLQLLLSQLKTLRLIPKAHHIIYTYTLIKHNRREIHVGLDMILPSDKHIRPQMNVQVTTLELSATDCIDKVRIPIHRLI